MPEATWRKAKAQAALDGITTEQWVVGLIEREIDGKRRKQ